MTITNDLLDGEGSANECSMCGAPSEDDIPIDYYLTIQRWLCADCMNSYFPDLAAEDEDGCEVEWDDEETYDDE